jgi:hypothetical protein
VPDSEFELEKTGENMKTQARMIIEYAFKQPPKKKVTELKKAGKITREHSTVF